MTEDRVKDMLYLWKRSMYAGKSKHLGYPSRSSGGFADASEDFDQAVGAADDRCAKATDSAIDGLPSDNKAAVYAKHLGGAWTLPDGLLGVHYASAVLQVGRALDRKGIV